MSAPWLHSILNHLCLFHWLTGLNCPLCGMTRAMLAMVHGRWQETIRYNALSPLGGAMLATLFWNHPLRGKLWRAGLLAFGTYGLARIGLKGI
jgi:hypothetical protein